MWFPSADDRSQFRSGDPDLDRFFHKFAGQNQFRHHVGVTYVAVEDRRVLGFATVAPGHVEIDGLPVAARLLRFRRTASMFYNGSIMVPRRPRCPA